MPTRPAVACWASASSARALPLNTFAPKARREVALAPRDRQVLEWFVEMLGATANDAALTQLAGLLASTGPTDPTTLYARLKLAELTRDAEQTATLAQALMFLWI